MIALCFRIIFVTILINSPLLQAQNEKSILDTLNNKLADFEYAETIKLCNDYIQTNNALTNETLIEIYLIKGISNYSLKNENEAEKDFKNILKISSDYKPNPLKISPKIISFFENIRTEYLQEQKTIFSSNTKLSADDSTKGIYDENVLLKEKMLLKDATIKSIVLPGWGQRTLNSESKGWIFTILSLAALGSSIYFIVDTNEKENAYLNEIDDSLIDSRYKSYNKSYQWRNISLGALVTMWLVNVIDILFISDQN